MRLCAKCGKKRPRTWYIRRADGGSTNWCRKCREPVWVRDNPLPPRCGTATVSDIIKIVLGVDRELGDGKAI